MARLLRLRIAVGPIVMSLLLALPAAGQSTRHVMDDTGRRLDIPEHPTRIVVLHEPLLGVPIADFGVAPVGSHGRDDDGRSLMSVDFYTTVLGPDAPNPLPRGIGPVAAIDIERLAALKPDLIIGTERDIMAAEKLTSVAPVYLQQSIRVGPSNFSAEISLAKLLGHSAAVEARLADYRSRIDALRPRLPAPRQIGKPTYLVVYLDDQINLVTDIAGIAEPMADLGYQRASLPGDPPPASAIRSAMFMPLSTELFAMLDPDLLILMNSFAGSKRDVTSTQAALDRLVPGWNDFLLPARDDRIVFVDSAKVSTASISSAEHLLAAVAQWADAR